MKRKVLLILLTLVTVLSFSAPTAALAAKPSSNLVAAGVITAIAPTELGETVSGAGNSGRWVVGDRTVGGALFGPALGGPFTFTYHANVAASQEGNLQGTMTNGLYVLNVVGKTQPYVIALTAYGYVPYIDISGKWTVLSGGKGNGDFTARIFFVPSADGSHIDLILPVNPDGSILSPINLTGTITP